MMGTVPLTAGIESFQPGGVVYLDASCINILFAFALLQLHVRGEEGYPVSVLLIGMAKDRAGCQSAIRQGTLKPEEGADGRKQRYQM